MKHIEYCIFSGSFPGQGNKRRLSILHESSLLCVLRTLSSGIIRSSGLVEYVLCMHHMPLLL